MSKAVTAGATALLGCILFAIPVTLRLSPEGKVSLSMESAPAGDADINRRAYRRAYRRDPNDWWACGQRRCDYSAYERFSTTDSGGITDSLTHRIGGVHRPQRPGTSHRAGTSASITTPPSSDRAGNHSHQEWKPTIT
jgi:hypothetical protein